MCRDAKGRQRPQSNGKWRVKSYTDLFDQRGSTYDQAMQHWPDARRQEFEQAIRAAQIEAGMVVADVPAGGGYLQNYAPTGCTVQGHEPCATFSDHHASGHGLTARPLLPLPWADQSIDIAISLAGVHHLADKRSLFADMLRVTRPGGRFVLSDVAADTNVALFLDGFVGANNSTGHEGAFLDERTVEELREAGWQIVSQEMASFHWVFAQREDMAGFCRGLFDICKVSPGKVEQALAECLGVDVLADGQIGLRWSLMTIVAERPAR